MHKLTLKNLPHLNRASFSSWGGDRMSNAAMSFRDQLIQNMPILHAINVPEHHQHALVEAMIGSSQRVRKFFSYWLASMGMAMARPVTRPQLIAKSCTPDDMLADRALWAWAAAWTLKVALSQATITDSSAQGVCGTCASLTGNWCERCDGPLCLMCEFYNERDTGPLRCGYCRRP